MTLDPQISELAREGLVSFKIDNRLFAIPIGLVREINRHLELTRVHCAPSCVRGLVNLRGQIVTVMDLGERLGFGEREIGEKSRLVVLKENADLRPNLPPGIETDGATIGMLVDEISDVLTPTRKDLETPPSHLDASERRFLLGVCKTAGNTVGILNPATLVQSATADPEYSLDGIGGGAAAAGSFEGRAHA